MTKYKIGDKVRVRSDLEAGKVYGGFRFTTEMSEVRGTVQEIARG